MANHGHYGAGTSRPQLASFPLPASIVPCGHCSPTPVSGRGGAAAPPHGVPAQSEAPLFANSQTLRPPHPGPSPTGGEGRVEVGRVPSPASGRGGGGDKGYPANARTIAAKSAGLRLAPPTSVPS